MRIASLAKRIIQQTIRDKRLLMLVLIVPLVVLTMMYFVFGSNASTNTLIVTETPDAFINQLKDTNLNVLKKDIYSIEALKEDGYSAWLNKNELLVLNDNPSFSKQLMMQLHALGQSGENSLNLKVSYVYGSEDTSTFDYISPILMCIFILLFVFLISGMGFLKERSSGTLERLLMTPIKRVEIVYGYVLGYGLFAVLQTIIIVLFGIFVLDMPNNGNLLYVILINLLLAFVALSIGLLLSSFAKTEFQMMQFIPIIIVPQIFFGGVFDISQMAIWLQPVRYVTPVYYAADAVQAVMYRGEGFEAIWFPCLILLLFGLLITFLNTVSLKKYRAF